MPRKQERKDSRGVLKLEQAAEVLDLTPEAIRQRIVKGEIKARYDRGSPKLGWIIENAEYVRYLRSIGEDARADEVERGIIPN